MAEEDEKTKEAEDEQAGSKGKGKIIVIALVVVLLIGASVGATMFFLGAFDPPPPTPEELAALEEAGPAGPTKKPAMYYPVKPTFVINFQSRGRQRFLQTDITIMTRDQEIFSAVQNHLPLIKNRLVMLLGGELYQDLQTDEGRELLRQKSMESVQQILKDEIGREDGVEQVLFTNFVMQ